MAVLQYRLAMPAPHTHLFEVEVRVPDPAGPVELVLPSWTPGSYLLREFPRHVQDFQARTAGGEALAWRKLDKGRWRVEAAAGAPLVVRYRVYANELSVRTSHLDASHAYVNGASVFMFVRGREAAPFELAVEAPAGWRASTALEATGPLAFRGRGYDELVDSPLEIGTHRLVEWEQDGIPHRYAVWGPGDFDAERLVADTRRIIAATQRLFGPLPYRDYTFILHLLPGGRGGLEHAASCSLQAEPDFFRGAAYESFLALVAHEFFHVWNAKRIRPEPLGPFDYTRENYTRNLWVVEGLTTYYTDRVLLRAGLMTPERYLERLGEAIARFQALPGRRHQSLEESSFDTWIKFYRPDEHSPNSQISYYQKGALVGLLLDMEIRRATRNRRSLDDLMRLLWERYGARDTGFPEDPERGIQALAEEVCGTSLRDFFEIHLRTTAELEYDRYLAAVGVRLAAEPTGAEPAALAKPAEAAVLESRLGIRTREADGRARVALVLADSPAHAAGLNAHDEIVALDGRRVGPAELADRLRDRAAGERVTLALFRRDQLLSLEVPLGPAPAPRPRLVRVDAPDARQEAAYRDWLALAEEPPSLDPHPEEG